MKTLNWSGYEWLTQERWGSIHKDKSYCWYDPSAVQTTLKGYLNLKTQYNPKEFPHLGVRSKIGVGLVSCVTEFGPGTFEIKAKLPYGKNLWPAFWMWSWDSWPPEIDVFEGYTHKRPDYKRFNWNKPWACWHIDTNVHYSRDGKSKMWGPKSHFMGFKNPTRDYIKYKLDWSLESLKFYYNDKLVRVVDDSVVMKQVNSTKMNVVINNHVTKDMPYSEIPDSNFTIKYFKYEKA